MIEKVISGGQTGADIGGLIWAKSKGIPTGGYIPKGFRTDEGPHPEYAEEYGLIETSSPGYKLRTMMNANMADGTLIFGNSQSPGCILTARSCAKYHKPSFSYAWPNISGYYRVYPISRWIKDNNIRILNVAGNREASNPGIRDAVIGFLNDQLNVG